MGERTGSGTNGGGGSALSVLAGAALGAAGLAWWLLSEAERRRQQVGHRPRSVRIATPSQPHPPAGQGGADRDLHDRVHELNQAIDDVRRQLETMNTQP